MDNREINQLVARHVMGWTDVGMHEHGRRNSLCAGCRQGHIEFVPHGWMPGEDSATHWRQQIPEFSTSAEAAKQVREKLAEKFVYVRVDICNVTPPPLPQIKSYICRAWNPEYYEAGFRAEADTEERAVALCALKAFQVLLPEESQEKV